MNFICKYFNCAIQRDLVAHIIAEDKASAAIKLVNTRSVGIIHFIKGAGL